jgi:hypothetical protein
MDMKIPVLFFLYKNAKVVVPKADLLAQDKK